jgi:uncharacterized membrane-anchored protein
VEIALTVLNTEIVIAFHPEYSVSSQKNTKNYCRKFIFVEVALIVTGVTVFSSQCNTLFYSVAIVLSSCELLFVTKVADIR